MEDYIARHIDPEPEYLRELSREVNLRMLYTRMMSGHIQGRLLKMIVGMIKPSRILEIGTFAGYSTLCMAEALAEGAYIDTIEINDELEPFLNEHFARYDLGKKIDLHIGDAISIVPELASKVKKWDMVFLDADKRLYPDYYEMILPYVNRGGWILADNTLWNGKVCQPMNSGCPENIKDSQLKGIIEFNDRVASDERVEKVILPLRDGLTIIKVL